MESVDGKKSKHVQMREHVERLIATGRYAPGDRLPSETELVAQFQTSRPTVARALRDLQHGGLIERRAGSGTYVRRRDDASAAAKPTCQLFGALIPNLGQTAIFEPICGEIARRLQIQGHALVWADCGGTPASVAGDGPASADRMQRAEQACRGFIERKTAGVFFAPIEYGDEVETNSRILQALAEARIPVVLLDRDAAVFPERSRYDVVGIDNVRGAVVLTRHLIEAGRKRLCFFARPHSAPTVDMRKSGFREALWRAGRSIDPADIVDGDPLDVKFVRKFLRARRPDAVVCANDMTAAALLQTLAELEVSVPNEVAVVGFDDVKYSRLLGPPLTTIRQPCEAIGQAALQVMFDRIREPDLPPRTVLLETTLVVRRSCGARSDEAVDESALEQS
jgi:DNA-binding LacI/PurR family transcriptional regulator